MSDHAREKSSTSADGGLQRGPQDELVQKAETLLRGLSNGGKWRSMRAGNQAVNITGPQTGDHCGASVVEGLPRAWSMHFVGINVFSLPKEFNVSRFTDADADFIAAAPRIIRELLAALPVQRGPDLTWQPIATAPKDGTAILLWKANRAIVEGWWSNGGSFAMPHWSTPTNLWQPTHWMPKPPAPDAALAVREQKGPNEETNAEVEDGQRGSAPLVQSLPEVDSAERVVAALAVREVRQDEKGDYDEEGNHRSHVWGVLACHACDCGGSHPDAKKPCSRILFKKPEPRAVREVRTEEHEQGQK